MSKILLAIETATPRAGVAIAVDGEIHSSWWLASGTKHTESLMPAVEFVMETSSIALSSLDAICIDVGPGLFTGIRVGLSTAKGLAHALGIPLVPVTSLEVMARPFAHIADLVTVIDAKRGEVFWRRFHSGAAEGNGPGGPALGVLSTPAALAEEIDSWRRAGDSPLFAGDGAHRYAGELKVGDEELMGSVFSNPLPEFLSELGFKNFLAGTASAPDSVEPLYMRQADARVNFELRG